MSDRNFAAWDRAYDRVRTAGSAEEARRAESGLAGLDEPRDHATPDAEEWAMHVMTGPGVKYPSGTPVRWLDGTGARRRGEVVGAIAAPFDTVYTYVILVTGPWQNGLPTHTFEQVDQVVLDHGWGTPAAETAAQDDDIPF